MAFEANYTAILNSNYSLWSTNFMNFYDKINQEDDDKLVYGILQNRYASLKIKNDLNTQITNLNTRLSNIEISFNLLEISFNDIKDLIVDISNNLANNSTISDISTSVLLLQIQDAQIRSDISFTDSLTTFKINTIQNDIQTINTTLSSLDSRITTLESN